MLPIRRLALRTLLVLCALAAGVLPAAAQTIGGYVLVRQQRIGPITLFVYRATLSNAGGPALQRATATATSSVRATSVLDGQLSYGPVAAGGSAISQDTITLMHIGPTPFSLSALHWTVTTQPAPVSLSLRIRPILSVTAGTSFSVAVEAMNGNSLDSTFSGTVTLNAAAFGGSNFTGGSRTATAVAGVATFSGLVLNDAADGYISSASASGATAATSNAFNVTADHLWVAQSLSDVAAGTAFNVATEARDANNSVAENFNGAVTLSAAAVGGSSFNGSSPAGTAAAGAVTFSGVALNNAAANYIVTATSAGLIDGTSNAFDVGPHHLTFTAPPASVLAGTSFGVAVEARDANDSVAENFSSTVTLDAAAFGGSNFNGGSRTATAVAGVATFVNLALNNAADGYTIAASASGATAANSNAFNVTADHLWVAQSLSNVAAGTAFNVATEARDANNSVAENFNGAVTLSAAAVGGSDFNGSSPAGAAAAGAVTFSGVALNNAAADYIVTATSAGLIDGTSNAFDVGPHHLTFSAQPPIRVRAGDAFDVTVEARDADNNVVENFSATVTLGAAAMGGSTFTGGSPTAIAVGGAATFSGLVLNNAANGYLISANAGGAGTGDSAIFDVTARALFVLPVPNQIPGAPFDVTVQARDGNGSVAENFTGTIGLSASAEDGGDFATSPAGPASAGVASFSGLILQTAATSYSITAVAPGVADGTSNLFDVLDAPDANAVLSVDGVGYAPFKAFLGGGFGYLPAHADYTLTNTGSAPMSWSAEVSDPWLLASPVSGTLEPGASVVVQLSIEAALANTLSAGEFTGRVYFSNRSGGTGSTTRPVSLANLGIWPLQVRPAYSLLATGSVQTPPAPATLTYTLTNLNTVIPVSWSGTSSQSWVQLSSSGGTIPGFQSVDVTATLTSPPNGFSLGTSAATLTFTQFNCCPDLLNFRFVKVIITEDDPPGLTVDAPLTVSMSTTLSGTVADNGTIASVVWSNAKTGETGTIDVNQGAWSVTIPLMAGTNDVTVTAFDDLGNFSSRTVSVEGALSLLAAEARGISYTVVGRHGVPKQFELAGDPRRPARRTSSEFGADLVYEEHGWSERDAPCGSAGSIMTASE